MKLLGFDITRTKAAVSAMSPTTNPALVPATWNTWQSNGGWYPIIREMFTGAWQRNIEFTVQDVLAFHAVFACVTLIASDIAKLRLKLVEQDSDGIWTEIESSAFSPVMRKPNRYQTHIKFFEQWMFSKLIRGNTYALKERDNRGVVVALYILDAGRVKPLVAPDGSVFYELHADNLAGIEEHTVVVPASEIIHDLMYALYHPLCGISPIYACGLGAIQGLRIQNHSATFFGNGARPGGILTAPAHIPQETADRLKRQWEENFGGVNQGKVAVLGDGLKYEPMVMTAVDAQMIESLKLTAEMVCSCFHVPPYKIGVGPLPSYNNVQALNVEYYSECLQVLIENLEASLDEGLGLTAVVGKRYGVEFDLDGLLRMDSVTQMAVLKEGIGAAVMAPNEARKKVDLKPVEGGASPMAQQQNYSLAALAKRDAMADPFGTAPKPAPAPQAENDDEEEDEESVERMARALSLELKALPPLLAA